MGDANNVALNFMNGAFFFCFFFFGFVSFPPYCSHCCRIIRMVCALRHQLLRTTIPEWKRKNCEVLGSIIIFCELKREERAEQIYKYHLAFYLKEMIEENMCTRYVFFFPPFSPVQIADVREHFIIHIDLVLCALCDSKSAKAKWKEI